MTPLELLAMQLNLLLRSLQMGCTYTDFVRQCTSLNATLLAVLNEHDGKGEIRVPFVMPESLAETMAADQIIPDTVEGAE